MIETGKITFQLGLLRRGLAGNLPEESESLIHIGKHARSFTHQMPYIPFILRRDLAQVGFARHRHFDPQSSLCRMFGGATHGQKPGMS